MVLKERNGNMRERNAMMGKTARGHKAGGNKGRIRVVNLQQQEKQLKNHEAKSVKGGGGARAGVDMPLKSNSDVQSTTIAEEIRS